ncbi:MAG: C40 family peptidase [Fidelibacterota bacterium]|nr:MAG: C40 family peptidase [Candidatus Neomarinimicrobiota bacterium]
MEKGRSRTGLVVNSGVVNLYREATFRSEVVSQALLGEIPEILDQQGKWFLVRQWDGYEGWMYYFYLFKNPQYLAQGGLTRVSALTAPIREKPTASASPIRDAVFGTELPVLSRKGSWIEVSLPDGLSGWLKDEPQKKPSGTVREQLVQVARRFLGVPYMWGGKTPNGFDCSGFVQTCFKAMDVDLPRDAHLQYRFQDLPEVAIKDAQPGDLFFFSEKDQRITHVTISLGGGEFIHSSGWVRIESLEKDDPRYNHLLRSIFAGGKDVTGLLNAN